MEVITERYKKSVEPVQQDSLSPVREEGWKIFKEKGIPTSRHEEWKYTRVSGLFDQGLDWVHEFEDVLPDYSAAKLPGHEQANVIVFLNGQFAPQHSSIISKGLTVMPLEKAGNEYPDVVRQYLGHSNHYLQDGINALNTFMINNGVYIEVARTAVIDAPVFVYHIMDATMRPVFSQPRSLMMVRQAAQVKMVETYITIGGEESLTNQVIEVVIEQDAELDYVKIQQDTNKASQVSTTHIRQLGKSEVHTVAVSLSGKVVRNNTHLLMEAAHCESHLYGLYIQDGECHVDNHTVVDNKQPDCYSNQLYKGVLKGNSTAVFNGKIFVRQAAQKTNAFQSNKNILLSDSATINTKPQLEIFADDVKCSHGCTVGRLDEEGMFYLRSRGIDEAMAQSLLLHSFTMDVLDQVRMPEIKAYLDEIISSKLNLI